MTADGLIILKQNLLTIVPKGLGEALLALKEQIPPHSPRINELVQLEAQLKEANKAKIKGVISQEDLQLRYNQIREELISLIQSLELSDFAAATASVKPGRQGSLLYNIPDQMRLEEETKCIVRLAFDEEVIIENIELEESVVLKTIRIAQIMQAEILDPNSKPSFAIRTISSSEQFLEEGAYTEWIYYVTPLREGTFPLLIKVAVVEIIQGKERVREIVWEEEVQIVTAGAKTEVAGNVFKSSGYSLSYGEEKKALTKYSPLPDEKSSSEKTKSKSSPIILPSPDTKSEERSISKRRQTPKPSPQRQGGRRMLNTLLGLLLVVSLTYVMVPSFFKVVDEKHHNKPMPTDEGDSEDSTQVPVDTVSLEDTLRTK